MRDRVKQNKSTIGKFKEQIQAEAEAYLKGRGEALGQLKSAQEAVAESRKAVQNAKRSVSTWNAYVALLQQGFSNLPDDFDELNKDTGLKALSKAASDVGKQEITFRDADGKTVKSPVAEVLKDQLPSITMMIDQDSKKGARSLPDAPGIALIIMNLGLGLAEIEQQRALTRFSQLNARAVLFEDALAAMELAEKLLAEVSQEIDSAVTENAFADITRLWHEAAELNDNPPQFMLKQNAISSTLVVLRKAANVEAIIARNQSLFQVAVARLEHQDSIVESAIGDAAWQVVISNGLNGLAAYHQSGFTKEDAANVIRIAQTIALGFIAAGTN
jgi:hypothetical protein